MIRLLRTNGIRRLTFTIHGRVRSWFASLFCIFVCCGPISASEPARWSSEISIRQFRVHSDFELDATEDLVAELDGMSHSIEQLLGVEVEQSEVHIVLFQTQAEYRRYMLNYFPQLPERRALYIQDRGPGMLFTHWHRDIAIDLRHEVTHALLNQTGHHLPLWLDEGLAEYYEVKADGRFQDCDYLSSVASRARLGLVPSLEKLEALVVQPTFDETNYRDSWAWVHFMLHRSQATRKLLVGYIHGVRSGAEQLKLSRQLKAMLPDLEKEFQAHFASLTVAAQASTK